MKMPDAPRAISPNNWLDSYLVNKVQRGDRRAFGRLYDRYANRVYYLLYRLSGSSDTAEDLTQETFVAAYNGLESWRAQGAFGNWLCGIATRQYRSRRRFAGREIQTESNESDEAIENAPASENEDPFAHCSRREAEAALDAAISSLSDSCREAFVLVRVEGMRYHEASEALGIPLGTLQSRLDRATRALRKQLSYLNDSPNSPKSVEASKS